jgi:hypothetical protein
MSASAVQPTGGQAEIFIDGQSRGVFNTAGGVNGAKNIAFGGLTPGSHVVSVTVVERTSDAGLYRCVGRPAHERGVAQRRPGRRDRPLPLQLHRLVAARASTSTPTTSDYLQTFVSASSNLWFSFVGTDLTVLGLNRANTAH